MAEELEQSRFDSADELVGLLSENQDFSRGVWFVIAKKGSAMSTVTYAEAVEAGLRFGWIDGQARRLDDEQYLQRFTPRRRQSPWSVRNVRKAGAMIEDGEMEPCGLVENPAATKFYATLNGQNRFAIYYRIQDAKRPETRARRIENFYGYGSRKGPGQMTIPATGRALSAGMRGGYGENFLDQQVNSWHSWGISNLHVTAHLARSHPFT